MHDVTFQFDVEAPASRVLEALTTTKGITAFWTTQADVPAEVGEVMEVGFAVAPAPFDLLLERSDERGVGWRTQTFPPHWVGSAISWDVEPVGEGSVVRFRHAGLPDDDAGRTAYTWGQIMVRLKEYAETGRANPLFS